MTQEQTLIYSEKKFSIIKLDSRKKNKLLLVLKTH